MAFLGPYFAIVLTWLLFIVLPFFLNAEPSRSEIAKVCRTHGGIAQVVGTRDYLPVEDLQYVVCRDGQIGKIG